ncbi:hypothetical protein [Actinoplanes utahensis]|uniref:Uncharacterized protein n=1 Tax=Actinoplanes utahensis TaxID=1869 RepID=A0A0A6UQ86_ACTUT|nr:hypothetical protein [Actinoplanes utahensis]KHD76544.1 hypothetical protein MB27_16190 [Actinoplanes utahensis]GIF31222.1 hypothetical protein Aut01nite_42080 [Actinoplanes utahensis]
MYTNPDPARLPRLRLRPVHTICLDTRHDNPDEPCPWCTAGADTDDALGIALTRHAELVAEDAEAFGWPA